MGRLFLFMILLYSGNLAFIHLYGQERCGANKLLQERIQRLGLTYEQYMEQAEQEMRDLSDTKHRAQNTDMYYIPVVMHILHLGASSVSNVSKERIDEQMRVLNEAYAESHGFVDNIPEEFVDDKAGDTRIRFALANRDPDGNPTDGITRQRIDRRRHSFKEITYIRPAWNQREYLNVWVHPVSVGSGYLGIATVPPTNDEPLERYDGIGMITESLPGSGGTTGEGKTLPHEAGHYLNLYHTWGKGGCTGGRADDGCSDTPLQSRALNESRCSRIRRTCGVRNMIENYMSYSADVCMVMFTKCQRSRMRSALFSSIHRKPVWQNAGNRISLTPFQAPSAMSYAEVRMYPNPALDRIHFAGLASAKSYPYKIYTATGLLMRSGVLHKSEAIHIGELLQGQYIVSLYTREGEKMFNKSLVVK